MNDSEEMAARARLHARVDHNMTNHPPISDDVTDAFAVLRQVFKQASHVVVSLVPAGREQSQALTDLEDGLQHAIAGIARNQGGYATDAVGRLKDALGHQSKDTNPGGTE